MSVPLKRRFACLLDRAGDLVQGAAAVEIWSFDDHSHRRTAEQRLAQAGTRARCRSAHKPLLPFFLAEVDRAERISARIACPVHPKAPGNRFRLETDPLVALPAGADLSCASRPGTDFTFGADLCFRDGRQESHAVFAPNRLHVDVQDRDAVSPTGRTIRDATGPGERLETEFEHLFRAMLDAAADRPQREAWQTGN